MSNENLMAIPGAFANTGKIEVEITADIGGGLVTLNHWAGPMLYRFHLKPEQSAALRAVLEAAEADAAAVTSVI